jgi:4-coumarate--CoA ligase
MNNAEETKGAFYEGWMRTGDIVRVDGEGFFYLIERKKEMIKYNG